MSTWNFRLKPVPQVARPFETTGQKFARKCKENPYVPIGGLLTVGNLVMAILHLARGESRKMNYWLRGRVAMQGITVVALLIGASRMGELDWGPDRVQRTVHWDVRQLLLQDQRTFLARKTAAQLMGDVEAKIYGKGAMAKHSEMATGLGPNIDSGKKPQSKGWLGRLSSSSEAGL